MVSRALEITLRIFVLLSLCYFTASEIVAKSTLVAVFGFTAVVSALYLLWHSIKKNDKNETVSIQTSEAHS